MADKPKLRAWPASKVRRWLLSRIREYEHNARIHSDEQVQQIAESMQRFGVTAPVLVDEDGVLIYGHGRLRAAQLLGFTHLPVAIAEGWTEEEKKAYRIADNQLALLSTWDERLLIDEIRTLEPADVELLGFTGPQLERLHNLDEVPRAEDLQHVYQVLIECNDEQEQLGVIERLQKDGIKCRALLA